MAGKDYRTDSSKTAPSKQSKGRKPADLKDNKKDGWDKMPAKTLKNKGANNVPGRKK